MDERWKLTENLWKSNENRRKLRGKAAHVKWKFGQLCGRVGEMWERDESDSEERRCYVLFLSVNKKSNRWKKRALIFHKLESILGRLWMMGRVSLGWQAIDRNILQRKFIATFISFSRKTIIQEGSFNPLRSLTPTLQHEHRVKLLQSFQQG